MHSVSKAIGEATVGMSTLVARPPKIIGTLIVGVVNVVIVLLHHSLS